MKLLATLATIAFAGSISLAAGGCVVRTGKSQHAVTGHPAKHRHDHCHAKGGPHDKRVCHSHPHGPGHH
jgi:hypothetical protein